MSNGEIINLSASRERPARTYSGYFMLLLLLVAIAVQVFGILGLVGQEGAAPPLAIAAVVALPVHPMISHEDEERVIVEQVDNTAHDRVHLRELCLHSLVVWAYTVANMVDTEEVADDDVPGSALVLEEREEMADDSFVYCV